MGKGGVGDLRAFSRSELSLGKHFFPIEAGFSLVRSVFLVPSGLAGFLGRGHTSFSGVSQ